MILVYQSDKIKGTSRGGGRVWTNLNESHEMRRKGEKFSWDLKVLKIPRGDKILRGFAPINANAATISGSVHTILCVCIVFLHGLFKVCFKIV